MHFLFLPHLLALSLKRLLSVAPFQVSGLQPNSSYVWRSRVAYPMVRYRAIVLPTYCHQYHMGWRKVAHFQGTHLLKFYTLSRL